MSHSTRKIKPEILSRQSGLDRVSRQTNQQLIRPIKKTFLMEEDCISGPIIILFSPADLSAGSGAFFAFSF